MFSNSPARLLLVMRVYIRSRSFCFRPFGWATVPAIPVVLFSFIAKISCARLLDSALWHGRLRRRTRQRLRDADEPPRQRADTPEVRWGLREVFEYGASILLAFSATLLGV